MISSLLLTFLFLNLEDMVEINNFLVTGIINKNPIKKRIVFHYWKTLHKNGKRLTFPELR